MEASGKARWRACSQAATSSKTGCIACSQSEPRQRRALARRTSSPTRPPGSPSVSFHASPPRQNWNIMNPSSPAAGSLAANFPVPCSAFMAPEVNAPKTSSPDSKSCKSTGPSSRTFPTSSASLPPPTSALPPTIYHYTGTGSCGGCIKYVG